MSDESVALDAINTTLITYLGNIDTNLTTLNTNVTTLNSKLDTLNTGIATLNTKIDSLLTKVDSLLTKIDSLLTKVDSLLTKMDTLNAALSGTGAVLADIGDILANELSYASKTVTGATKTNPVVVTVVAHGFFNGNLVKFSEVGGMTQLNGNSYKIALATTDTFTLQDPLTGSDIDGISFGTYTSGGKVYKEDFSAGVGSLVVSLGEMKVQFEDLNEKLATLAPAFKVGAPQNVAKNVQDIRDILSESFEKTKKAIRRAGLE